MQNGPHARLLQEVTQYDPEAVAKPQAMGFGVAAEMICRISLVSGPTCTGCSWHGLSGQLLHAIARADAHVVHAVDGGTLHGTVQPFPGRTSRVPVFSRHGTSFDAKIKLKSSLRLALQSAPLLWYTQHYQHLSSHGSCSLWDRSPEGFTAVV